MDPPRSSETPESISALARKCRALLGEYISMSTCIDKDDVEEQLGRFNLWVVNFGVLASPPASLDYRLRNSHEPRDIIMGQLSCLYDILLDCTAKRGEPDALQGIVRRSTSASFASIDVDSFSSDSSSISSDGSNDQFLYAMVQCIDCLLRFGHGLRNHSTYNKNRKARAADFVERDEEGREIAPLLNSFFTHFIRQRHPLVAEDVCKRLATAALLRRKRIKYARMHQKKLAVDAMIRETQTSPIIAAPSTHQMIPVMSNPNQEEVIQPNIRAESIIKTPAAPKSIMSATVASTISIGQWKMQMQSWVKPSSVASSTSLFGREDAVQYPAPPRLDGKECICPYCSCALDRDITLHSRRWKAHVKEDIEPLVCILDSCPQPDGLYSTVKSWMEHSRQHTHRTRWRCPRHDTDEYFDTEEECKTHMLSIHNVPRGQIEIIIRAVATVEDQVFESCPLCEPDGDGDDHFYEAKRLERHIAKHLISLALVLLPRDTDGFDWSSPAPISRTGSVMAEKSTNRSGLIEGSSLLNSLQWEGIRQLAESDGNAV